MNATIRRIGLAVFSNLLLIVYLLSVPALSQDVPSSDKVAHARYAIQIHDGKFEGSGESVLHQALSGAQFVALGEDHGMQQIPQFTAALCQTLAPQGFHTMAVEVGPLVAQALQPMLNDAQGSASGAKALISFNHEFPEAVAFYNWQQEFDALSACAHAAPAGKFRLWGLDQEFLGSSRLILTRIQQQYPGKAAADEVERLLRKDAENHTAAAKSGNPGELFMFTVTEAELKHFHELLQQDGNPRSLALLDALIETREIYIKNSTDGRASNRQRALLMKSNFMAQYRAATKAEGAAPKVLLKFGAYHMWKGVNQIHNLDVGNMLTELADSEHQQSLHILMMGAKGKQAQFAGINRPDVPASFDTLKDEDSDFRFLKPILDHLEPTGWTLVDLRQLRAAVRRKDGVEADLDRLMYGYDLLIIVPEATASTPLQ